MLFGKICFYCGTGVVTFEVEPTERRKDVTYLAQYETIVSMVGNTKHNITLKLSNHNSNHKYNHGGQRLWPVF